MAYAGICGINDIEPHSIAYFHTISFDEIMDLVYYYGTCAIATSTGNNAPVVTAPSNYTIPYFTPFVLDGTVTDPDGDVLTYQWEEIDNGLGGNWNDGDAPYFRSYNPVSVTSRIFPSLITLQSGNYTGTPGEYLPSTPQTLNFRLVARDNKVGGGGVCYSGTVVNIDASGPFSITYPNSTGITWASASSQIVTWSVNATDMPPVSCANVNILLSTDGGATFTMLLANTPNDGTQLINVPAFSVTKNNCRIKVESVGNIFFDMSNNDFTITAGFIGVNEYVNNVGLAVFPNPFTNELQVNISGLNKDEKSTLVIYDVIGNVLFTDAFVKTSDISKKYNTSFLSKGIYFIEIFNKQQRITSKLVKN